MKIKIIACTVKSVIIVTLIYIFSWLSYPLSVFSSEKIDQLEIDRINGLISYSEFSFLSKLYNSIPNICGIAILVLLLFLVITITLTVIKIRKGE